MLATKRHLWLYVAVRVQLSKFNEEKLKPIVDGSRGTTTVYMLMNAIITNWICVPGNLKKVESLYARPQKPVSRK